jgi:hypothetical protein
MNTLVLAESGKSTTINVSAAAMEQFCKNKVKIWEDLANDVIQHMNKHTNITDFDKLEPYLEVLMEAHSEAFSWTPKTGKEQEALLQYISGDCARFWNGKSDGVELAPGFWLMLKIRKELPKNGTIGAAVATTTTTKSPTIHVSAAALKQSLDKIREENSEIWDNLATEVSRHMNKDTNITDFDTLEPLLETLMEVHSEAFSWAPKTGKDQEALMQYITGDCARFWNGKSDGVELAPGFWLMLNIRQELCEAKAAAEAKAEAEAFTLSCDNI